MQIINEADFKGTFKGKETALYTLKNKNGLVAQVTNFGAKIVSLFVPDRDGNFVDVVQGYNTIEEWIKGNAYFGATCGRVANRIAKGKFTIDGVEYQLPINNGPNSLHGGPEGFSNQMYEADGVIETDGQQSVSMKYVSVDGEEGYPGTVTFTITFSLNDDNEFRLDYHATTDKATHVNIASHSFFNLEGEACQQIDDHIIMINANSFTPTDETNVPTGEILPVEGTPFDFREPKVVGKDIDADDEQIKYGVGYDHNFVLDKPLNEMGLAAVYTEPKSGRVMEVYTTQPGVQFYSNNWMDGTDKGKSGIGYEKRSSLCLETQHFADSANKPNFPTTLLKPGEDYKHTCIHKFATV